MGTKNNPGDYDCYQHAHPDEPMFVLLGRDPLAGLLVRLWAEARAELGETSEEKLAEAYRCADAMVGWARNERSKSIAIARAALHVVILRRTDPFSPARTKALQEQADLMASEPDQPSHALYKAELAREYERTLQTANTIIGQQADEMAVLQTTIEQLTGLLEKKESK
jgi:hypothetical protein